MKSGRLLALGLIFLVNFHSVALAAPPDRLIIIDNDFGVPTSAVQAIPLIASPSVKILGLTTVIGDSYVNDDVAHVLRFLEIIGRGDIPVFAGTNRPLVRTKGELYAWEHLYGSLPWKGAWNETPQGTVPIEPAGIHPMEAGLTKLKPASGNAVTFLVDQVRAHKGEISIEAAGPLTNIALAVRLDPDFAANVKELVIMGGLVDSNQKQITEDANFNTDFNFMFDPEAADIVLSAGFPKIKIVGRVANKVRLTPDFLKQIVALRTPLTDYYARFALKGLPLCDELAAAILLDPTIVTASTKAYMRVNLDHGMNYGSAHVWPEETRPHQGEQLVEIVDDIDADRFRALMVASLQMNLPNKASQQASARTR